MQNTKVSYIICVIGGFLLYNLQLFGQEDIDKEVIIYGTVKSGVSKLPIVKIEVFEDGKEFENDTTPENANFAFNLHYNHNYTIDFSKSGYFSKKLEISTFNVPKEETDLGFEYKLNITLYKKVEGVDTSILKNPIGKIAFDKHYVNFEYDEKYMRQVKPKLLKLQNQIEQILQQQQLAEKQYSEAIDKGDHAYQTENFVVAKKEFTQALNIKPTEEYPREMLIKVEQALIQKEEEIARLKAIEEKYQAVILIADNAFTKKSYEEAKVKYNEASQIKPKEKYPISRINEIDNIINDLATEAEKQRIKEEKYTNVIKQADQAFFIKQYRTAKNYYESASQLKPEERYPKEKISEINKLIAEATAAKAIDEKYQNAVNSADRFMKQYKYEKAMSFYQEANEVKPNESYPIEQLQKIDKILNDLAKANELDEQYRSQIRVADKAYQQNLLQDARNAYQQALQIKPDADYPKNRIKELDGMIAENSAKEEAERNYKEYLKNADQYFLQQDFQDARTAYQKALNIKPTEQYPKDKLAETDQKIHELENRRSLRERYKKIIANADALFQAKELNDAKALYQSALGILPDEKYPKDQLVLINKMIDGKIAALSNDKKYASLISKADQNFELKQYQVSKSIYQDALSLKPGEEYPEQQISKIDSIITIAKATIAALNNKYNRIIASADSAFSIKDYATAKSKYKDAIELNPKETYPKNKLNEVNKLLYIASTGKQEYAIENNKEVKEEDYSNIEEFKNELARKYPPGLTEEVIHEKGRVITRRIIVVDNRGDEYKFIKYNWGGKYYFKNGKPITELSWTKNTVK